jgi:hypothetical protein
MTQVTILEQQTVFDLALQELGSAEGVFDILAANTTMSLDADLASGQKMIVSSTAINTTLVDTYLNNSIKPGNGIGAVIQVLGTADGRAVLANGKYIKIKIKK